jgi:hypothetical protein
VNGGAVNRTYGFLRRVTCGNRFAGVIRAEDEKITRAEESESSVRPTL